MNVTQSVEDRREALRQPTRELPFKVEIEGQGVHEAVLLDVSRTGVRFRTELCVPCGTMIILHPPEGTGLHANDAQVVRQIMTDPTMESVEFEYGARFVERNEIHRHTWFLTLRKAA